MSLPTVQLIGTSSTDPCLIKLFRAHPRNIGAVGGQDKERPVDAASWKGSDEGLQHRSAARCIIDLTAVSQLAGEPHDLGYGTRATRGGTARKHAGIGIKGS